MQTNSTHAQVWQPLSMLFWELQKQELKPCCSWSLCVTAVSPPTFVRPEGGSRIDKVQSVLVLHVASD